MRVAWKADQLRMLKHRIDGSLVQFVFAAKPSVSPTFLARVPRGDWIMLRHSGTAIKFSRKVAVRSLGENTARAVSHYIDHQIDNADFADASFARSIGPYTRRFPKINPNQPIEVTRGRYWYCLHLVLVTAERYRFCRVECFKRIYDRCLQIADRKAYRIAAISVMPDHLHLNLVGSVEHSPEQIALAFQNNLAFAFDQTRIW
ncbi:MAG: transposase [Pirellulaceae bacterium]